MKINAYMSIVSFDLPFNNSDAVAFHKSVEHDFIMV